jgi:hypothetical protein
MTQTFSSDIKKLAVKLSDQSGWNATAYKSGITLPPYNDHIAVIFPPRCLYNKVRYFRGFCVLVRGGANV